MKPHYTDGETTVYLGDCIEVMRTLPDNSVDAVVTDPPYGLGFMGKHWDALPPGLDFAEEAYRVLKPGGHILAFGGSRTWHRLAVAIEDAGFELRDSIAWLYGSGFPKSMDVSKAIDKMRTEDVEPTRAICRVVRAAMDAQGLKSKHLTQHFDDCNPRLIDHWAARDTDSQPNLPTPGQWLTLRQVLGINDPKVDAEVARLNARKGEHGEQWHARPIVGEHEGSLPGLAGERFAARDNLIRGEGSDAAREWEGWGTALKPAFEPIVVGRKPLVGTVAANVLAHGVGALNIDATRVHSHDSEAKAYTVQRMAPGATQNATGKTHTEGVEFSGETKAGRWPTNVILDDSQAAALDAEVGTLTSGKMKPTRPKGGNRNTYGQDAAAGYETMETYGDSGGPSRFFPTFKYQAKAPKSERPLVDGVAHATVKPIELMRWLIRLVVPKGATILEPFAGSGTTVEAAILEGVNVIAIEREEEYWPLIRHRIARGNDVL